ncbi:MAG: 2-hydroxymuconate tautomerase [Pigmentiphaga sp.]|uniref:2-hydroxymuconate tautomerase n=1 Tax=Pigmentiphaga sp. TaxID=1977564 RepID=UPI0029B20E79|nr:2-hydroxymuconate tautomerase [Pigmentiphaga sp.]MDX3905112.1 2-hydroxymuconate tautomerase [Pigmentiphaga sp.]
MPIVKIELLPGRPDQVKEAIAAEITDTMVRHTGSAPEHIYVMFDEVAHNNWAVAGKTFARQEGGK